MNDWTGCISHLSLFFFFFTCMGIALYFFFCSSKLFVSITLIDTYDNRVVGVHEWRNDCFPCVTSQLCLTSKYEK